MRKWLTSLGFSIFGISFFSFSFLFLQWLTFYWACLWLKNLKESVIKTGNFYHGAARCSGRKFWSEFFAQLFEHFCVYLRLPWADHSYLGIIGKIFSSCRSWVSVMPILVKSDDVRSGRKVKGGYGRHRSQWVKHARFWVADGNRKCTIFYFNSHC